MRLQVGNAFQSVFSYLWDQFYAFTDLPKAYGRTRRYAEQKKLPLPAGGKCYTMLERYTVTENENSADFRQTAQGDNRRFADNKDAHKNNHQSTTP